MITKQENMFSKHLDILLLYYNIKFFRDYFCFTNFHLISNFILIFRPTIHFHFHIYIFYLIEFLYFLTRENVVFLVKLALHC